MVKDYFEDITPHHAPHHSGGPHHHAAKHHAREASEEPEEDSTQEVPIRIDAGELPRGIRSIAPSRHGRSARASGSFRGGHPSGGEKVSRMYGGKSRRLLWIALAAVGVIIIGAAFLLLRPTTVTITPRAHTIVLSSATSFTAYPAASAASDTLTYTTATADLEDSAVVAASATVTTAAAKASGRITVYNAYSASSVKLIKNTRFETPDGLVFRTPAEVVVPGQKGSTPGSVTVTVVADKEGESYNVGPVSKFTVPGLSGNPAMYKGVYAKSSEPMTGGASASNGPGIDPATLSSTIEKLKANLASKAEDSALAQAGENGVVLLELMQVTYTNQPSTPEAGGNMRVHESAHVVVPIFDKVAFGRTVGSAVSADADNAPVVLTPGEGFAVERTGANAVLGSDPLQFTLTGQAELIWSVDEKALTEALAGRDQGAFQTVISGFSGIQEARARIEPFWKNSFPSDPSNIKVVLTEPKSDQ